MGVALGHGEKSPGLAALSSRLVLLYRACQAFSLPNADDGAVILSAAKDLFLLLPALDPPHGQRIYVVHGRALPL